MGAQKHKSNGGYVGGLLQLFDWNVKSRKKLFASKSDVPDGIKQGKRHDNNLPATRFHLNDDEAGGLASVRGGGSDYSCASSVTEDEGARAPGVVARLMGLESFPTSSANEPYTTPSFDSRSLQDSYYHKSNVEFLNDYRAMYSHQQLYKFDDRREIVEPKPPRLSTRPIEKFQSESLAPKTAKPVPLTHHKLLSPIKSPGFISPKSAAHIMEAAAKILDPSLHAIPRGQFSSFSSSSATNKTWDLRENALISSRNQTRISEASRRPVDSNASKILKGQSLTKSWNGSDEAPVFKVSPEVNGQFVAGSKNNGRSVSLAVQAKVNVLKRESLNSSNKTVVSHKDDDDITPKQSFRIQRNTVKSEQNRPSTLGVLRQNNQKQNFAGSRDKLGGSKSFGSSQQVKKVSSSEKVGSKSLSKVSANSKGGFKSECNDVSGPVKMDASSSSSSKHFPRKKRAIASDVSDKANFVNASLADRNDKRMQPHLGINEHNSDVEGVGKRGMDVVSFTFTSPMTKSSSQSPDWKTEKLENFSYISPRSEKNACTSKGKKISSLGLNVIGGDALSILLEQKLRELTTEIESSSTNSVKGGNTSMCILQDLVSAFNSASTNQSEFDGRHFPHQTSRTDVESNSIFSLPDPPARKINKLQNAKEMVVDDSFIGTIDGDQYQRPSPVSILDASFSIESFHSSEGADVISGCMESSVEANLDITVSSKAPSLSSAEHAELSDCASSSGQSFTNELGSGSKCQVGLSNPQEQPLGYIKHVVSQTRKSVESFLLGRSNEILDPALFDKLENEGDETHGNRLVRRALFDCVAECLNTQYGHHVKAGYSSWSRGMVVLRSNDRVAQEIYKEISDWKNMSEWMVDELVDKDMSSHLGKWTNFDIEGFELGVEVEEAVLSSLLDEVVADLLV